MRPKVTLILVHGLGAYAERWQYLIKFFKKHHIRCIAHNFPAQGPLKDWEKMIDVLIQKGTGTKSGTEDVYLIGESLGGLVVYNKLLKYNKNRRIAGCILISPAFKNIMPFSFIKYMTILIGLVLPWIKIKAPFSAAMCTRDGSYQQKMQINKHETRNFSSRLYIDILFQQIYAIFKRPQSACPFLFLLASNDVMVSITMAKKIYTKLPSSVPKKCITYPNAAHALSIDTCRQKVFTDMLKWIQGV